MERFALDPGGDSFAPQELTFDLYGFYGSRDKGGSDEDAWGPGVGINYFITKYVGVGAETYADAFEPPYLINGMGIFRYPLGDSGLAPYAFGGFGRQWDHAAQWLGYIGGGLEYRLNPLTGAFVDVREVFADRTRDYEMVRFGFRFQLR